MSNSPDLRVGVLTQRTAVVLIASPDILYRLPEVQPWRLAGPDEDRTGSAEIVAVFLDSLAPDTEYAFLAGESKIRFRTRPCAGMVDAGDFAIDESAPENSAAFAKAISSVPEGGTLRIPDGCWQTGPLFLKPNMTLYLAQGAQLLGASDRKVYPILPECDDRGRMLGTWEGLPAPMFSSLITAIDCDDLSITGAGTIDGGAERADWWRDHKTMRGAWRPRTVFALRSDQFSLSGVTIRNSPSWTIHPVNCRDVRIAGITVWNPSDSPNTDGLNPEMCRDVRIEGTLFSVGDDCIAIKAGKRTDAGKGDHLSSTENVRVRNCRMERGHGAVVIGSEMSGSVTDVRIENCEFDQTDRGLRIKTRRGRGGRVANISLRDCAMDHVDTAFSANAHYFCDHDGHSEHVQSRAPARVSDLTPRIDGIDVARVKVANTRLAVGAFLGLAEAPVSGVSLRDVQFGFDPHASAHVPLMADHVPAMRHESLWAENARVSWNGVTNGTALPEVVPGDALLTYFDAFARRFTPYKRGNWCYEDGLIYLGLIALHRVTGDSLWFGHLRRLADARIGGDGKLDGYEISEYNIDNILAGRALFHLSEETGDLRYQDAADLLATQLRNHPRTLGGNYWHKLRYPWQLWLDGLYMGLPFQIEYGLRCGLGDLVEDALAQIRTALEQMFKPQTGLHAHAWDEKRLQLWADPDTGFNPDHWARANGWLAMALVDICELIGLPRAEQTGLARATADILHRIGELQTAGGFWLQVPDQPELAGNYEEMSASAMFTYALLKAARIGVRPCDAADLGRTGFAALEAVVAGNGRAELGAGLGPMCHVAGLGGFDGRFRDGSAAYYVSETICEDDPKGVGPMMMAAAEMIREARQPTRRVIGK